MKELLLEPWLIAWWVNIVFVMAVLAFLKIPTGGLTAAYFLNTTVLYFFGAAINALPWYNQSEYLDVYRGFILTSWGMFAFSAGNLIFFLLFKGRLNRRFKNTPVYVVDESLPVLYFLVGTFFYFVIYPFIKSIPSIGLIGHSGWFLMVAGICLSAAEAWRQKQGGKLIRWVTLALFFPFLTMVSQGFMSFGISAVLVVLAFVACFYKPKWKVILTGALFIYLGLSVFVTYFRDRTETREAVWYEETSISEKMSRYMTTFRNFEFFDLYNPKHLAAIQLRLNQNILVGQSVDYLEAGYEDFARGETFLNALIACVPRFFWPDKPVETGGSELVGKYTGQIFEGFTTVGVGQVMEFYINFGFWGVIVCYAILGAVIAFFDSMTGFWLKKGEYKNCVFWLLSGMALLQPGDSLVEMASTMAASVLFAIGVNKFVLSKVSPKIVSIKALMIFTRRKKKL